MRQEIELARAEMTEKGKRAGMGAGMLGGAGVAGLLALGALTACLIARARRGDGDVARRADRDRRLGGRRGVLALQGPRQGPGGDAAGTQQTVETVKEDVQWAKTRTGSGAR